MSTAQDLINYALTTLALPSTSIAAGLPDGLTQNSYTISSLAQCLIWLTEGQNRIGRACLAIPDSATFVVTVAGFQSVGPYTNINSLAGRNLLVPATIADNATGRVLTAANQGFINSQANSYPPQPGGGPTAWTNLRTAAWLSSFTTTPTLLIMGYFLPQNMKYLQNGCSTSGVSNETLTLASAPPFYPEIGDVLYLNGGTVTPGIYTITAVASATSVTITPNPGASSSSNVNVASVVDPYIDDIAWRTVAYYLAWMIAQKNAANNVLQSRIAVCANEVVIGMKEMYDTSIANDPTLAGYFPPDVLDTQITFIEQKQPRA